MIEGLFRRPPEDDAIPVLTEIIAPPPMPDAPIVTPGPIEYRGDPMSADYVADQFPIPAPAPAQVAQPAPESPTVQAPMPAPAPDSQFDIPPLVIHLPDETPAPAPPPAVGTYTIPTLTASLDAGMPADARPVTDTQRLALLPDSDRAQLEERLHAAVIARLHPRIDAMLDHQMAESIRAVLEAELPALHDKLRTALTETLNDVVTRAISKELAKINSARTAE